ncbi:PefC/AfrB family outer membrane usher protein [Yersinia enterocolitica]
MLFCPRIFASSTLILILFSHCSVADEELNFNFIHGTNYVPSILKSNSKYPAGQYYVDIIVNKENIGKAKLNITPEEEEANALCFSSKWLKMAGIPIHLDSYASEFNQSRMCYQLSKSPYTRIDFNYGTQSLIFSIPQSNLVSKTDPSQWDYGVNAARLKYFGNFSQTSGKKTSAFANTDLIVNMGRWVLASNMNATKNTSGSSEFAARDIALSTAISQVHGDLILGKSQTRSESFSDFGFYGVSLRSNSNMTPWEYRGYAPVINGIANSTSRITITQDGYTVYSKVVPPGPYQLDDVRPIGNGDLKVTVEDESGHKTTTTYSVTTLPTLLRPGELQYNVSTGRKTSSSNLKDAFSSGENGIFWMGSVGYGLSSTTLNIASILHDKYKASGGSLTQNLGFWGAFSVGGNMSHVRYDNGTKKHGYSLNAKYAKSFTNTTDLQLLAYRYQSRGYVEFSDFDSKNQYVNDKKSRYAMQLSQRLSDLTNLNLSAWQENYWVKNSKTTGGDISFSSTIFRDVSMFLRGSYSKQPYLNKADYSTSISFSVPFTLGGVRHYSSTGMSYSNNSKIGMNAGVSANPTDRLGYGLNTSLSEKGERSLSGSVSYGFDSIQTNLMVSQGRNKTSLSGGVRGTLLGTPESGILMTRETNDTIGVVRIPNVAGVRFNRSAPTDRKGYTVVNLSDYTVNQISANMENVPDSLDLKTTSYSVVPTANAVVYREFGVEHVQRYILRVIDRKGKVLDGGNARTDQGLDAGFIANNGVLLMNMLSIPKFVNVDLSNGSVCRFSMSGIKANINKVQEVRCE